MIDKVFLLMELFGLWGEEAEVPKLSDVTLDKALESLTERERMAVTYRFAERLTYSQMGASFGVTRERARQILAKAMRKLRHPLRLGHIMKPCNLDDIANLSISTRSSNALRRMGINTISSLTSLRPADLLKSRNVGRVMLRDIERSLAIIGKRLS